MTDAERVAAYRKRQAKQGIQKVELQLPEATIRTLDKMAKLSNESRSTVIDLLIKQGNSTLSAKQGSRSVKKKVIKKKGGECFLCGQHRPDSELKELGRGEHRYTQAQCIDFVECNTKRGIIK